MQSEGRLIRDGVYDRIRSEILSCVIEPGSRIHENDLAQRYEVSKSPVRDALLRLQQLDLIEVLPRKGYRVRPISANGARELYEMRTLLECTCMERGIEHATDEALMGLDGFRTTEAGVKLAHWVRYNRDFHLAIAGISGNARLTKATTEVIEQFDRLTFVSVSHVDPDVAARTFVAEHCEIVDAIQARDKRRAVSLLTNHINSSRKRLLEALDNPPIVP